MSTLAGEHTLVASWRALARLSRGAHVSDRGHGVAAVFPSWKPLNNAIAHPAPSTTGLDAVAAELARVYAGAGVPDWALWLRSPLTELQPPPATPAPAGMVADTRTLAMVREVTPGPGHPSVVRTSIEAAARATDEPVHTLPEPDGVPGLDGWVLVHGGAAVAGAWSYLHGTDCGLYAVGTIPALRRRGLAAALVRHVLSDAYRRGARTASLQSTPMGVSLYRSLGFTPVGRYEEWVPRAAATAVTSVEEEST